MKKYNVKLYSQMIRNKTRKLCNRIPYLRFFTKEKCKKIKILIQPRSFIPCHLILLKNLRGHLIYELHEYKFNFFSPFFGVVSCHTFFILFAAIMFFTSNSFFSKNFHFFVSFSLPRVPSCVTF